MLQNKDSEYTVRDLSMEFGGVPLFEELKYFYNNDVCLSCAICLSIMESGKYNLRTYAYYYENVVHRIKEVWCRLRHGDLSFISILLCALMCQYSFCCILCIHFMFT